MGADVFPLYLCQFYSRTRRELNSVDFHICILLRLYFLSPPKGKKRQESPPPHLRKLLNQDNDSGILIVLAISQVNPKVLGSLFCLRFKKDPDRGSYTDLVYIKPYCRIAPYLVGIALGYLIYIEKVAPSESPLVSTCRR